MRSRDFPSICALGHDLGLVWQDDRGTYQNIYYRHGFASFHDVGCRMILMPSGSVDSGVVVTPACSVYNYDTTSETYSVRLKIGTGYDETVQVAGHEGRTSRYVTFPDWTAGPRGSPAVSCSTELSTDAWHVNDLATGVVNVQVHDVGCTRILAPIDTVDSGTGVFPRAEIKNCGNVSETFPVWFWVGSVFTDSATATLAAGAFDTIDFQSWVAEPIGSFVIRCSTALTGDLSPANDLQTDSIVVWPPTGIEEPSSLPTVFALDRPLPTPFTSRTTIRFSVPRRTQASVSIYSATGALVKTLCYSSLLPAHYSLTWSGRDDRGAAAPRGVYYCRMTAGDFRAMKKLVKLD